MMKSHFDLLIDRFVPYHVTLPSLTEPPFETQQLSGVAISPNDSQFVSPFDVYFGTNYYQC